MHNAQPQQDKEPAPGLWHRERMNGGGVSPDFLHRWLLLSTPWGKLYLHRFLNDDAVEDPHDHPKNFLTIGLLGGYREDIYNQDGSLETTKIWDAPWIRWFPASHIHRVRPYCDWDSPTIDCWTLVWVGKKRREWGFYLPGSEKPGVRRRWVHWEEYIKNYAPMRVNLAAWVGHNFTPHRRVDVPEQPRTDRHE